MPAALNDDRVYNVTTNYPSLTTAQLLDPSQTSDMYFVLKGVTYIRWVSTTEVLTEYDRRRIYDVKKKNIILSKVDTTSLNDIDKIDILKKIALIGCWNENNENDRELISKFFKDGL